MKFVITNEVRRPQTRVHRATAPTRARSTQRICGNQFRLVRGKNRPGISIDRAMLEEHWDELWDKQEQGLIAVHVGSFNGPLFNFGEKAPEESKSAAPEVTDDEPEDEKSTEDDPEEETEEAEESSKEEEPEEDVTPEPEKPVERMNKVELVAHAAAVLGEEEDDLEPLTKKQIIERLG